MVGSSIGFDTSGLRISQSSKQEFMLHRRGMGKGIRDKLHKHTPIKTKVQKPKKKKSN